MLMNVEEFDAHGGDDNDAGGTRGAVNGVVLTCACDRTAGEVHGVVAYTVCTSSTTEIDEMVWCCPTDKDRQPVASRSTVLVVRTRPGQVLIYA